MPLATHAGLIDRATCVVRALGKQPDRLPQCFWLTGLSGAGKTTLAQALAKDLQRRGVRVSLLDGDAIRDKISADLGFSRVDRRENVRRIAALARLQADEGLTVIVACISPFAEDRDEVRQSFAVGDFCEVHVATPLSVCEMRDCKGLYGKARRGEITAFTGISSPYEAPVHPDVTVLSEGTIPTAAIAAEILDRWVS